MKIAGSSVLHAEPERVWAAINDPTVLATVIPGCNRLQPLGDGHFGLTVTLGVAAIKGSYSGEVKLYNKTAPSTLTMRAAGAGAPGTIDTTVGVRLTDLNDGTTQLDYDADAVVGGAVGGVGQRVLTSVAKKTAGQFFSAIDDVLTGKKTTRTAPSGVAAVSATLSAPVAARPTAPGAPGEAPAFGATLATPSPAAPGQRPMLAAAALGAASMLIGVLIGARIARGRSRG